MEFCIQSSDYLSTDPDEDETAEHDTQGRATSRSEHAIRERSGLLHTGENITVVTLTRG